MRWNPFSRKEPFPAKAYAPDSPPPGYGPDFLAWFKRTTEVFWAKHESRTLVQYAQEGVGGSDWANGTRWTGGLSDAEIARIEAVWNVRFPAGHRLFLQMVHATDRPMSNAYYLDEENMAMRQEPGVHDWRNETEIRDALESALRGIVFDVEHHRVWHAEWGERPRTADARESKVRDAFERAPRLIPILGHRYLLSDEAGIGSAVLSIHQTDMIVYGSDLRT